MKTSSVGYNYLPIHPKYDISIYQGYDYFHEKCKIVEANGRKRLRLPKLIPEEYLYRAKRFIAFVDYMVSMQPFNANSKPSDMYHYLNGVFSPLRNIGFLDHVSYLEDYDGVGYCLNEPYHYPVDWQERLFAVGMVGIIVPKNIAPYHDSKRWPLAASFLITTIRNLNDGRWAEIEAKLLEAGSYYV